MAFTSSENTIRVIVVFGSKERIRRSSDVTKPLLLLSGMLIATGATSTAPAPGTAGDLEFFVGSTESVSITKVMLQKPFVTHCVGRGRINSDGSLELLQHVREQGGRDFDRRWHIHQVAPRHLLGTMSEASGPVSVDKIGDRYRFRFTMNGKLSVEQWLTPQRDMMAAQTQLTVRRLGIAVVHSTGWIRRMNLVQVRVREPLRQGSS